MRNWFCLFVLTIGLAGCSASNSANCPQPKTVVPGKSASLDELEGFVKSCLHSKAYQLSSAPGTSEQIADSVIHACGGRIANWKLTIENSNGEYAVAALGDAYFDPVEDEFRREAILRVTEARAGKCTLQ